MKIRFLFLLMMACFIHCKQSTHPIVDTTSEIKGFVMDFDTHGTVTDALIGFTNGDVSDSLLIDQLNRDGYYDDSIRDIDVTSSVGSFSFIEFLGTWPPLYENMFVYKQGYKLWRCGDDYTISHVRQYEDSLNIFIKKVE